MAQNYAGIYIGLRPIHLIYISKPAGREKKTQGSCWESNPGPPAQPAGALTTELRFLTATCICKHMEYHISLRSCCGEIKLEALLDVLGQACTCSYIDINFYHAVI